jgi:hypothetical protein
MRYSKKIKRCHWLKLKQKKKEEEANFKCLKGGFTRISDSILLGTTRNASYALGVVISNCSAQSRSHT